MSAAGEAKVTGERLAGSTTRVAALTVLSRITGLARDIVFSRAFGASPLMDAFFVAFKIPNLLRRFFAEGAFAQAFVPVLAEYRASREPAATRALVDDVAGTLGVALFAVTAAGVLAAPLLILVFAPGFAGGDARYALATDMLRLTLPYLLFISLTAFAGAVLNAYRRFAAPAFTPVLLNLVLIVFAAWVAPSMDRPHLGLAAGVLAAGVVQLAFQAPFLVKLGLLPRPRWRPRDPGVGRVLHLMGPVLFGSSVAQINLLIDTLIASFLAAGSISYLYYSDRLMAFPLGVVGAALATVILPSLSEQHTGATRAAFSATLDWALRCVAVVAVPAAVGLAVLAEPLMAAIFYGGAFDAGDVAMAAASLRAFAPGLVGFILVKVLASACFARQDTRTPVRIGVHALLLNLVLNVALVTLLSETAWAPAHAGLALATALSGLFNAAMLLAALVSAGVFRTRTRWPALLGRVGAGCAAMTVFLVWLLQSAGDWPAMSTGARLTRLTLAVAGGAAVYAAVCAAAGLRPRTLAHDERPTEDARGEGPD